MPSHILPQYVQDLKVEQPSKKWFWILLVTIIFLVLIGASVLIYCLTRNDATDNSGSTVKPNTVPPDVGTTKDSASTENIPKTCTTSSCQDDATILINAMDPSVDPCEDFFQYACGGFNAKNPGKDTRNIMRQQATSGISKILKAPNDPNDPIPVNQARDFYAACTNTAHREKVGIRPLIDLLRIYGGWPMTLQSWSAENFSWQKAAADIRDVFITVSNDVSPHGDSKNLIQIDQPSLILPRDELLQKTRIVEYTAFITGAAIEIRDALKSTVTNSQIEKDIADMLKFESALAFITTHSEDPKRKKFSWMYKPMNLDDLQAWTDRVTTSKAHAQIDWFDIVNRIYIQGAGIDIQKDERILVSETIYLQNLIALLDKTPGRTIANYVHWNLVYRLAGKTNQRMRDLNYHFNWIPDLDQSCANEANELFGFAISNKYVASNFDGKNEVMAMVTNLKAASKYLVTESTWMDSFTKAKLNQKVDDMVSNIGYPDWIMDKASLESYYTTLSISRMNYFESYQNASLFINTKTFKRLRERTDREIWDVFPDSYHARYHPRYHAITITTGYLQFPFFKKGRLAALNYGAIGSIIGHEITHSFGDQRQWESEAETNHRSRVQCLIDQYSNYTSPIGTFLNGEKTRDEDIADNVGLRQAFLAYKLYVAANGIEPKLPGLERFSSEQLFFLSYANKYCDNRDAETLEYYVQMGTYSLNKYRLVGSISNNDDFVNQFKCPVGSPMNRVNKCVIW